MALVKKIHQAECSASDLFTDTGHLKGYIKDHYEKNNNIRPSTIRLESGIIIARDGFVCPDCKETFIGPDVLINHCEKVHNNTSQETESALAKFKREHGLKAACVGGFMIGGVVGAGSVWGASQLYNFIQNARNSENTWNIINKVKNTSWDIFNKFKAEDAEETKEAEQNYCLQESLLLELKEAVKQRKL